MDQVIVTTTRKLQESIVNERWWLQSIRLKLTDTTSAQNRTKEYDA